MAAITGTFQASNGVWTEVGFAVSGGVIELQNRGPHVVTVGSSPSVDQNSVWPAQTANQVEPAGVLLAPGQSTQVLVPTYPVANGTVVPAVGAIGGDSTIAFSFLGA